MLNKQKKSRSINLLFDNFLDFSFFSPYCF